MKNTKSIVIVLFVLLMAQIASAYYCPSTGRWLSRDPIGEPGFQALQIASQTSIKPTPLPSSDRWISRDPIPGREGKNLYGFVENEAISQVDYLGLCKCGVKSFKYLDQGWTTTATGYEYKFDIVIKFKKDNGFDPKCCRYIQWIQSTMSLNGIPQTASAGGTPLDGKLHVDAWPYKGDNDTNPEGGVYQDSDPADDVYKSQDRPSWGGFQNGDVVLDDNAFRGTVIDICNGNKVVARNGFKMKASGTWPKLTYTP